MAAAVDLLLQNPEASMSDIAAHAGVGRATLYRHFQHREELVRELAKESLVLTDEAIRPVDAACLKGKEAIEMVIDRIMPLADHYHFLLALWSIAEQDKEVMVIYQRQLDSLANRVEQGKKEGSINSSLSTTWIVTAFDSLLYGAWWMIGQGEMSCEQAAESVKETFFNGV